MADLSRLLKSSSRDLRLLLLASTVDSIGTWVYSAVLAVYLYSRTGSPGIVAVSLAASWLPRAVVSPYAGLLADRRERVRVMVGAAGASGVLASGLTWAVYDDAALWLILVLVGALATVACFYQPAAKALLPAVVDPKDLATANALQNSLENAVVVVGPAAGAALLSVTTPWVGIAANAASFFISAAVSICLRVKSAPAVATAGIGLHRSIAEGARAVRSQSLVLVLIGLALLGTAGYGALSVMYLPLARRVGLGDSGYGYLIACLAAGSVLAVVFVPRLERRSKLSPVIYGALALFAGSVAAAGLVTTAFAGLALQVSAGLGMALVDIFAIAVLQREIANQLLSRVLGLFESLTFVALLLGSAFGTVLLRLVPAGLALVLLGAVTLGLATLSLGALRAAADSQARST